MQNARKEMMASARSFFALKQNARFCGERHFLLIVLGGLNQKFRKGVGRHITPYNTETVGWPSKHSNRPCTSCARDVPSIIHHACRAFQMTTLAGEGSFWGGNFDTTPPLENTLLEGVGGRISEEN